MFTGIIEEIGTVAALDSHADSARVRIRGPLVVSDAVHGSSIAVNGVCLTVVDLDDEEFYCICIGADPYTGSFRRKLMLRRCPEVFGKGAIPGELRAG